METFGGMSKDKIARYLNQDCNRKLQLRVLSKYKELTADYCSDQLKGLKLTKAERKARLEACRNRSRGYYPGGNIIVQRPAKPETPPPSNGGNGQNGPGNGQNGPGNGGNGPGNGGNGQMPGMAKI